MLLPVHSAQSLGLVRICGGSGSGEVGMGELDRVVAQVQASLVGKYGMVFMGD